MNSDSKNNFNRTLSLILPYRKKDLKLSVLFNKHNTYTAYHIDQVVYHSLKQRNTLQIFFDIRKSQFCNTFFDCNDLHDEGCNIQNNFNGIFTQYKDIMYYDSKESIVLDKVLYGNSFLENKIDINIIRLYKFPNDFLLCLSNRQFVNEKTKKRIVRSSCFISYSRECGNYLQNLYKKYKSDSVKYETCQDAMESLFQQDLTPQQIQNGFQL